MTASTARHPGFAHEALFHAGPHELTANLGPELVAGMDRGDAVLVCLPEPEWKHLAGSLGPRATAVRYLGPDERYGRPGAAMAWLHQFVRDALSAGASRAWSIGTMPFDGTPRDRRWVRYEHAVQEVLGHVPLKAVCTCDTTTTPPGRLADARRAHQPHVAPLRSERTHRSAPVLELTPTNASSVRSALGAAFSGSFGRARLDELRLVATELVTNAFRHGQQPVIVRAWAIDGDAVVEVVDHGAGWADRYPDLRANTGSATGGYGWYLVGQIADVIEVECDGHGTTITATLRP